MHSSLRQRHDDENHCLSLLSEPLLYDRLAASELVSCIEARVLSFCLHDGQRCASAGIIPMIIVSDISPSDLGDESN